MPWIANGSAAAHESSAWWRHDGDGNPTGVLTLAVVRAVNAASAYGSCDGGQWDPVCSDPEYSLSDVVPRVDEDRVDARALPPALVETLNRRLAAYFNMFEGETMRRPALRMLVRIVMTVGVARLM